MVRIINAVDTYFVRHQELRQGKPIETCIFPRDELPTTLHFGYFENKEIIAVVSAFLNDNQNFEYQNQYQIRGMAVLSKFQGLGVGKKLFLEVEQFLLNINVDFIWFNARLIAIPFYQSLNCKIIGNQFDVEDVGLHYLMYKNL